MARPKVQAPREAANLAFDQAATALGLLDGERARILGSSRGQFDRLLLFVTIYEEAASVFGEASIWLKGPNTGNPFEGKAPLAFILEDPKKNLIRTLQYWDRTTGGWV